MENFSKETLDQVLSLCGQGLQEIVMQFMSNLSEEAHKQTTDMLCGIIASSPRIEKVDLWTFIEENYGNHLV